MHNFFVKMGPTGLNQDTSQALSALKLIGERNVLCDGSDNDDKSDSIRTTYKRSATPYRTAKEK